MLINGEINNHELIKGDVCPTCGARWYMKKVVLGVRLVISANVDRR